MPEQPLPAPRSSTSRPLVLVVDDEASIRSELREALEAAGFSVAETATGPEGLALVGELQPELVLLDDRMPGSDGLEICRVLRERPASRQLPVVMMIAGDDAAAIQRAFAVGADDFVVKPIAASQLGHHLHFLLRTAGAMRELGETQARLLQAQRMARLGSWRWSAGSETLELSGEAARLYGLERQRVPLEVLLAQVAAEDRSRLERAFAGARREGVPFDLDHRVRLADGTSAYLHSQGLVGEAAGDGAFTLSGTCQDISDRHRNEEKIRYLAHYDPLTGLPNRLLFNELLAHILAYSRRLRRQLVLLFLDLDRFKEINRSLGHRAGDELLRQVAERLKGVTRRTDFVARPDRERFAQDVARLGGDEFSVWLPDVRHLQDVLKVLRRIRQAFEAPFQVEQQEISLSFRIGIAFYPHDGAEVETLLENAEAAMQHARQDEVEACHFYSGSMHAAARRLLTLEKNLRQAREREQMVLRFRPQLEPASGRIVGAEALLRWDFPEEGLILPGEFLPLAEGSGLISRLGEWALQAACHQATAWQKQGLPPLQLTVELPSQSCWSEQLGTSVTRVLADTGFDPERLQLGLTEEVLRQHRGDLLSTLGYLQTLGIGIALDEFGGGTSSLTQLKRFPFRELKLGPALLRDLPRDRAALGIVRAVIRLGHDLGLRVVAAGVENAAQLAVLAAEGCDGIQGPVVGEALPADAFADLLRRWRPEALPAVFPAVPGAPGE